jgi:hypothetical protein
MQHVLHTNPGGWGKIPACCLQLLCCASSARLFDGQACKHYA